MGKDGVVEILGIDGINGDERQVAYILACALDFRQGERFGFRNDFFRERDADVILVEANQASRFPPRRRADDFRDFSQAHVALIAA